MPRNQGTSRKGKPKKHERAAGMGRALLKSRPKRHTPSASTGGMAMRHGIESINNVVVENRASVLDVNDLDDFLVQAEMANREFLSEKEQVVVVDSTAQATSTLEIEDGNHAVTLQGHGPASSHFAFQELSVPRRPAWDESTSAAELDKQEKEAFLDWRRAIALKEQEIIYKSSSSASSVISPLGVTPFEKNIEIWRQLWRVLERCSCIVQIVDARNPLFYLSKDLKDYTTNELGKPMLLLINKSDYLTPVQRRAWHEYFSDPRHAWEHVFFSAHQEQQVLDLEASVAAKEEAERKQCGLCQAQLTEMTKGRMENNAVDDEITSDEAVDNESTNGGNTPVHPTPVNVGVETPLSRNQLLDWLHRFAKENGCLADPKYDRIPFGMVGFPNVGKSSVINVLMGNARNMHGVVRVGVASQPGKTKHFQTLLLPDRDDILLCDCPGLVFPSFVNNTADLIAAGVYPIAQMRDWKPVMELLCRRIPREVLDAQYGIQIPMPTADAMMIARQDGDIRQTPPPTADEFLTSFCLSRNMLAAASGAPDYQRASRLIIKEYADGKLLYCHPPPEYDDSIYQKETLLMALHKTKKLREKLLNCSTNIIRAGPKEEVSDNGISQDDGSTSDDDMDDDALLLEMMGGVSTTTDDSNSKDQNPPRKKTWGRKGRKIRNKDPYGIFSSPDELLGEEKGKAAPLGVTVKGGKHGRKDYTRQTGYGGIRALR